MTWRTDEMPKDESVLVQWEDGTMSVAHKSSYDRRVHHSCDPCEGQPQDIVAAWQPLPKPAPKPFRTETLNWYQGAPEYEEGTRYLIVEWHSGYRMILIYCHGGEWFLAGGQCQYNMDEDAVTRHARVEWCKS